MEELLTTVILHNSTPITPLLCSREEVLPVCILTQDEKARRDALAGLRLIVSTLSVLGASSIIFSAIRRKRVFNSKVHPLFVLSIADLMLSLLWGVGAVLWLARSEELKRGWCMFVSLITIIIECVAINLTLVYALLAYQHIKNLDIRLQSPQHYGHRSPGVLTAGSVAEVKTKWYPIKSTIMYMVAWLLPVVLVMVPFAFLVNVNDYKILGHMPDCTCWCLPSFGNVVPLSVPSSNATARYSYEFNKILLLYAVVISTNYLTGFIILVACYMKILRYIHNLNREYNNFHGARRYGTIKVQIKQAQSQARRRVVAFVVVFILSGFSNLVLSLIVLQHEARTLAKEDVNNLSHHTVTGHVHQLPLYVYIVFYIQSLTVPMQGFLNAMVYGWTRDDFVNAVVTKKSGDGQNSPTHPLENEQPSMNEDSYDDESEDQRTLVQTIPDLSGSTNDREEYSQVFGGEAQTDLETDDDLKAYRV